MNTNTGLLRNYLLSLEATLQGVARVTFKEEPVHARDPGLYVEIAPVRPEAAAINVHVESANQVDIDLGIGTHAELYSKDPEELVTQLREVIESVVAGGFQETVWRRQGRIVRAKGILHLGKGFRTIRYWSLAALLTLGLSERLDRSYVPYRADAQSL